MCRNRDQDGKDCKRVLFDQSFLVPKGNQGRMKHWNWWRIKRWDWLLEKEWNIGKMEHWENGTLRRMKHFHRSTIQNMTYFDRNIRLDSFSNYKASDSQKENKFSPKQKSLWFTRLSFPALPWLITAMSIFWTIVFN